MAAETRTKILPSSSSLDRINAYAEGVLSGEIVAGPHVRDACRRHKGGMGKGAERGRLGDGEAGGRVFGVFEEGVRVRGGAVEGVAVQLDPLQALFVGS